MPESAPDRNNHIFGRSNVRPPGRRHKSSFMPETSPPSRSFNSPHASAISHRRFAISHPQLPICNLPWPFVRLLKVEFKPF
jgi:hypothetical protein